jgi:hypothetical protein
MIAAGFSTVASAERPGAVPPTGLPESAPPFGLPDSAPPFGRGKGFVNGKGKGLAVARVSYHCLGVEAQAFNKRAAFSYLADSIVSDAGGGRKGTFDGIATGDLVAEGITAPTHMASASFGAKGLMLQPFDTCGTSAGSVLNSVVTGVDLTDSSIVGAATVEFRVHYHVKLEFQNTGRFKGDFSAFTKTSIQVLGLEESSFKVRADGKIIEAPQGMEVRDMSVGDHYVYEVEGMHAIDSGEVSGLNIKGSKIVTGSASAEAMDGITYEIVSSDPNVSFSFVPAQAASYETVGAVLP